MNSTTQTLGVFLSWRWITFCFCVLTIAHGLGIVFLLGSKAILIPPFGSATAMLVVNAMFLLLAGKYFSLVSDGTALSEMLIAGFFYFAILFILREQQLSFIIGTVTRKFVVISLFSAWRLAFLALGFLGGRFLRSRTNPTTQ